MNPFLSHEELATLPAALQAKIRNMAAQQGQSFQASTTATATPDGQIGANLMLEKSKGTKDTSFNMVFDNSGNSEMRYFRCFGKVGNIDGRADIAKEYGTMGKATGGTKGVNSHQFYCDSVAFSPIWVSKIEYKSKLNQIEGDAIHFVEVNDEIVDPSSDAKTTVRFLVPSTNNDTWTVKNQVASYTKEVLSFDAHTHFILPVAADDVVTLTFHEKFEAGATAVRAKR